MVGYEPIDRSFFEPSAKEVAPRLLGHWLVRRTGQGVCGGMIVETEAYLADDPACHAFKGETRRNRAMFGPAGHSYVYLIYGMHHCFNTVCRPEGSGEAVLIRAVEAEIGVDLMRQRRPVGGLAGLTNGPAKLCSALGIDREQDGWDLCVPGSDLMVARNPDREAAVVERGPVRATGRIGISRAADWPLRFCLSGSRFLSRGM